MTSNFFNISDLDKESLFQILDKETNYHILQNKHIGLLFEKYSTRTRLSFSVGIARLGGNAINIRLEELNISRDESFEDTFRAMNCYLDGLIYRTNDHKKLIRASKYFTKPIINALSDLSHPCQIISDLYTIKQKFGSLDIHILWVGDMNNVCFSLIEAVNLIDDLNLSICTPTSISSKRNHKINNNINIYNNLDDIDLSSVKCVMTDVFISMNDKNNQSKISLLENYRVDDELMSKTHKESVFMHCLPAKIDSEVTKEVYLGPKSIIWKQAYNRMIAQEKLLNYLY